MCSVRWKWLYWTCILWNGQSLLKLCDESLQWFNSLHQINVSLTSLQCFLNLPTPNTNLFDSRTKDLRLLLLYAKQYHYACKTMQKKQDTFEFISKFIIQLEIDKWLDVTMLPFAPAVYICSKLERHIVCNIYYRKHYLLFFIKNIISCNNSLFLHYFCNLLQYCNIFVSIKKKSCPYNVRLIKTDQLLSTSAFR